MKKRILLILNGKLVADHVVAAAIEMSVATSSELNAVFINYALDLAEYQYPFPNDISLTRNNLTGKTIAEEDAELMENNIKSFMHKCEIAGVAFDVETGKETSLQWLKTNSAFADLILADANENLRQHHIVDLLIDAHCPIYLVSKHASAVKNVIFTYDGSFSSMRAIKMYTYLFRNTHQLPATLVHVSDKNRQLPEEKYIRSWLSLHYREVEYKILNGNIQHELVNYTRSSPDSLVVMGSFGRTTLSRFFHKSLANYIVEEGRCSLFITHEK